jgi:ArsR family transcriptional regulator
MLHMTRGPLPRITRICATLADATRLRILRLVIRQELCVCEVVDALRIPQYRVSRHLRELRTAGLIESRRDGRWMHYRLGRHLAPGGTYADLLRVLKRHLDRLPEARQDDVHLRGRLALRRSGACVLGRIPR